MRSSASEVTSSRVLFIAIKCCFFFLLLAFNKYEGSHEWKSYNHCQLQVILVVANSTEQHETAKPHILYVPCQLSTMRVVKEL